VVGSHGELEVVLGVLASAVLEVQQCSCIVDEHGQLLVSRVEVIHKLPHRLQVRKVQLHTISISK